MRQKCQHKRGTPRKGQPAVSPGQRPGYEDNTQKLKNGQKHYYHIAMLLPILGVLHHHSGPRALPRAVCSLPILGDKHHENYLF
jgi:hypothetical protein